MDYKNIETCAEHEKVHIPDKSLEKLWDNLVKIFCVVGSVTVGFTACSGEKEVKKDVEETTIPKDKVENKVDKNAYNDIEDKIVVDESVTSRGEETERPVNKEENSIEKYNELLNTMNSELAKKNFSKEANQAFKRVLDKLYKNYPTWQAVYKDLPPVEEYIQNNLIDSIKNINSLTIYEYNSEEAKKLREQGQALGQTDSDGNITMIYMGEGDQIDDIERTFHEIIHCKQKQILFNEEYFKGNEELRLLILEGSTTFNEKFVNPLDTRVGGTWSISNESGTATINYNKDNCIGYLVELNAFENLVYLAGYNTMDKVEKGEISLSELKETIAKNYGQEKTNKIWNTMNKWYSAYNENWKSDETYEVAIDLQELYFDCIKKDIGDLKTKDQVKKFMDIWRGYKLKVLPQIEDSDAKNITNEFFEEIDEMDDLLTDKIIESDIMCFTPNEKMNRAAIKNGVLSASNEGYLPPTIEGTNYKYKGNGKSNVSYQNRYGETVNVEITFDENGIKEIKEAEVMQYEMER